MKSKWKLNSISSSLGGLLEAEPYSLPASVLDSWTDIHSQGHKAYSI